MRSRDASLVGMSPPMALSLRPRPLPLRRHHQAHMQRVPYTQISHTRRTRRASLPCPRTCDRIQVPRISRRRRFSAHRHPISPIVPRRWQGSGTSASPYTTVFPGHHPRRLHHRYPARSCQVALLRLRVPHYHAPPICIHHSLRRIQPSCIRQRDVLRTLGDRLNIAFEFELDAYELIARPAFAD
ncbi:hypothetical protein BD626DRAFT_39155 [Schizophyllum amplum]|uniref:Uncharacterized protein n=1 Tax=Schizophyllum amplum TaxID=97359 RepID=A0A550BT39_9AGAR|nr:hypothetical protein BD626DRAFT_39155 [Auriculariopsis ampla]